MMFLETSSTTSFIDPYHIFSKYSNGTMYATRDYSFHKKKRLHAVDRSSLFKVNKEHARGWQLVV